MPKHHKGYCCCSEYQCGLSDVLLADFLRVLYKSTLVFLGGFQVSNWAMIFLLRKTAFGLVFHPCSHMSCFSSHQVALVP